MTVQGIGIQQHSYPSHSIHLVFPGSVPAGLPILVIDEEPLRGRTAFVGSAKVEDAIVRRMFSKLEDSSI